MKTKFTTVLLVLSLALGCSKSSDPAPTIVGTWTISSVTDSGCTISSYNGSDVYTCPATSTSSCMRYTFNADNTVSITFTPYSGAPTTISGTYSISGDKLTTVITGSSQVSTFALTAKTLTLTSKDSSTGCTSVTAATSDPASSNATASTSATIGGTAFTATTSKATDTGSGLVIVTSSGDQMITIVTDDKKAGTYTMINPSGGRMQAGTSAYCTYIKGTDIYFSTNGTVTLTVDASGKVSGTFNLNLKNSAGTTLTITSGKFSDQTVGAVQAPSGKCLITSTVTNGVTYTVAYDADGKLLKVVGSDGSYDIYIWAGNVVTTHYNWLSNGNSRAENWIYSNGRISKVLRTDRENGVANTYTVDYTLNAAGQPTKVVYTRSTGVTTYNFTYDSNGNCTNATYSSNHVESFGLYDNKPNVESFVSAALGITFLPGDSGGDFSKNNVGASGDNFGYSSTYAYTYNSKGNVATKTSTDKYTSGTTTSTTTTTTTFNYSCN